jgi:hypothetical protein
LQTSPPHHPPTHTHTHTHRVTPPSNFKTFLFSALTLYFLQILLSFHANGQSPQTEHQLSKSRHPVCSVQAVPSAGTCRNALSSGCRGGRSAGCSSVRSTGCGAHGQRALFTRNHMRKPAKPSDNAQGQGQLWPAFAVLWNGSGTCLS